jgi:enoyl-CoA hydratase
MSGEAPSLIYHRQGQTVVLAMNRPAWRNAMSLDMLLRFVEAWEAIDGDDTIRSVILAGANSADCVGGHLDIGWMAGGRPAELTENERRAM